MCNCNQQRAAYTSENNPAQKGMVKVKLIENKPLVLNGDITGRMYVFRNINDINWVDRRDAISMKKIKEIQILH
ncbi:MAG TPA: hypothetical protein VJY62_09900 [Bacteroidia bacterium]|nr:hypothetical protein [Bacteroidia bacterium]